MRKQIGLALIGSNLVLAGMVAYQWTAGPKEPAVYADHVQRIRVDTQNGGMLHVDVGTSSTPGGPVVGPQAGPTVSLTPRAAIQLNQSLGQMIRLIQEAAAEAGQPVDQPEAPESAAIWPRDADINLGQASGAVDTERIQPGVVTASFKVSGPVTKDSSSQLISPVKTLTISVPLDDMIAVVTAH